MSPLLTNLRIRQSHKFIISHNNQRHGYNQTSNIKLIKLIVVYDIFNVIFVLKELVLWSNGDEVQEKRFKFIAILHVSPCLSTKIIRCSTLKPQTIHFSQKS